MTASERLARFVHELDLAAIPLAAREHAKLCLMDTLGIAFAATKEPAAIAAATVARRTSGAPESTLLVHGDRVPAPMAALANGTAAFSHNFTDTTLSCVIHGGPVAVPAALAAGEMMTASGAEVLTAIVAGYEVMTRIGNSINSGTARMAHHKKGYHPTATCGVFGAAAIAAKLTGLSVEGTVAALGIAGSFASGLAESLTDGSDVWRAHGGIAAHNGVLAALLARAGLTGPRGVLDGKKGFCTAFTDGRYDAGALVEGLGERWLVQDAAFKLHNTAHVWALPLDALAAVRAAHPFSVADVERMEVTFPQNWTAIMDDPSGATYAPVNYASRRPTGRRPAWRLSSGPAPATSWTWSIRAALRRTRRPARSSKSSSIRWQRRSSPPEGLPGSRPPSLPSRMRRPSGTSRDSAPSRSAMGSSTAVRNAERRSDSSNLEERGQTARLNGASPVRLIQHRRTPGLLVLGSGRAWLGHKFLVPPGRGRLWVLSVLSNSCGGWPTPRPRGRVRARSSRVARPGRSRPTSSRPQP